MIGASGGSSFFLLIIVAFVFLYFILVRPQKRRQLEQQRMHNQLQVGDEVVTAGGIYGEVTAIGEADDVTVKIAPDVEVRLARRAIGAVTPRAAGDEPAAEDAGFERPDEPEPPEPTPGT
jgi:preprotein translocase subunit YajC